MDKNSEKALPTNLRELVDEKAYTQAVEQILAYAKQAGATAVEVGLVASQGLNVTTRMGEVETLEFSRDKSVGVTVYIGQQKGSASTTDISTDSLKQSVDAALHLAKLTQSDPFAGLAAKEEMAFGFRDCDLYHPWQLDVYEAIELAKKCEESALSFDKKIVNSEGATVNSNQGYHVYGNSHGFIGGYPSSSHYISCAVIGEENKNMERDYDYTISRQPHLLEPVENVGQKAAQKTLARLNARKIATQKAPVLFHANIAFGLINHLIAALSGGKLFRQSSFLLDSLGKQILPSFFHLDERPHLPAGLASSPFDSDGVKTTPKDIIKDGVVASYVLSAYSARKLGMANTGNAGGTHNLFVATGQDDFSALISKMHQGLVITELMGQGINLVTGNYSRGASGFWVENGKIQYPVHEITIAGNLKDMFSQIVAIGKDVDIRHSTQSGSILIEEMMLGGS